MSTSTPKATVAPMTRGADDVRGADASSAVREPLDARGADLLSRLPPEVSLRTTASRFPHVLNRLAAKWFQPREFNAEIDALLLDDRTDRQGFPFETILELSSLREHYVDRVAPRLQALPPAPTTRMTPRGPRR